MLSSWQKKKKWIHELFVCFQEINREIIGWLFKMQTRSMTRTCVYIIWTMSFTLDVGRCLNLGSFVITYYVHPSLNHDSCHLSQISRDLLPCGRNSAIAVLFLVCFAIQNEKLNWKCTCTEAQRHGGTLTRHSNKCERRAALTAFYGVSFLLFIPWRTESSV